MLELASVLALAATCAPQAAPSTMAAIAFVESRFDPLAIGINRGPRPSERPATPAQAAEQARRILRAGGDVDLGLGQINIRNLARTGLSLEQAFDPCLNLAASSQILTRNFQSTRSSAPDEQSALRIALSLYNTGHARRGFENGYVRRVEGAARTLSGERADQDAHKRERAVTPRIDTQEDVFAKPERAHLVFLPAPPPPPIKEGFSP